jgi:hypothetical protein
VDVREGDLEAVGRLDYFEETQMIQDEIFCVKSDGRDKETRYNSPWTYRMGLNRNPSEWLVEMMEPLLSPIQKLYECNFIRQKHN